MKKFIALAVAAMLSGCSGLTVQWTAVASYSTADAAPVIHLPAVVAPPAPAVDTRSSTAVPAAK